MDRAIFRSKHATETARLTFDFASGLAIGESIVSANTGAVVYSGPTDATLPTFEFFPVAGSEVSVNAAAGTEGVTYVVVCLATTSLGQVLSQSGFLVIVPVVN